MIAAQGLPASMIDADLCIDKGDCHCSKVAPDVGFRVIPIQIAGQSGLQHCAKVGFETAVNIQSALTPAVCSKSSKLEIVMTGALLTKQKGCKLECGNFYIL
jgi:hypothetical protein